MLFPFLALRLLHLVISGKNNLLIKRYKMHDEIT
jgi:hypothetical protein